VLQDAHAVPTGLEREALLDELTRNAKRVVRARRREFRESAICGRVLPNEHMMARSCDPGVNVCQGCAETKYGVVS
jgi:hypothetical protein